MSASKQNERSGMLKAAGIGIAEADSRSENRFSQRRRDFERQFGSLPKGASSLFADVLWYLRDVLLSNYTLEEAHALMREYSPLGVGANLPSPYRTLVPADVELALQLLNMVAATTLGDREQRLKLLLGGAGVRGAKHDAGSSKGTDASSRLRAKKASARHAKWVAKGRLLKAIGTSACNITSKVATNFNVTPATVRPILQGAGVLPPKKKRK